MAQIPISDIDDPRLACYRNLTTTNLTRQSGLFIAEGEKVAQRLIASDFAVESILAEPPLADSYEHLVPAATPIYICSHDLLAKTVGFHFHRGIMACGRRRPGPSISELVHRLDPAATLLVCPDVQDPTNLGSIIRTGAAFGCAGVVLGKRCADPFSRRVLRVSMGAALQIPLVESRDLAADFTHLKEAGFELIAAVLDPAATPLSQAARGDKLALLLGSEGHGLGAEWVSLSHRQVTIPMELGIDSLNVAVAAAVMLYHFTR